MKILHIVPSYAPAWHLGGVVSAVTHLCTGLAQAGADVTVFTTDSGQDRRMPVPLNQAIELNGVRVYYFKTDFSLRYGYSQALKTACRQSLKGFDLVHVTSFWCYPAIPAISSARHHQIPYLISVHGTLRNMALKLHDLKRFLYFHAIEKRHIEFAAALHYTTEMERQLDDVHHFSVPSFIVPNGMEAQESRGDVDTEQARQSYGLAPGLQVITFLGRLAPVKALDRLLKAVASPTLRDQPLQVVIAGPDAGARSSLEHLAKELRIESQVLFLGAIDPQERGRLFAASNILALVSENENFGYTAVEAMSAGVPVLVSQGVGICREVLADGAGLVVPLEVEAIARAIMEMFADHDKLEAMGQAAARAARQRYDLPNVAQKMLQAYQDILTGTRSPGLAWSGQHQAPASR
jgi:glycosyltransferase involved in cell wall biosynthesis